MDVSKVRGDFMVYVVDDEESIRSILQESLSRAGYQVKTHASADIAWQVIQTEAPHVILSDIRMPGMSGIELLEKVRIFSADIQFIIMTSHASLDTALQAIRLGAYDYLHKPFEDLDDVIVNVDRTVEKLYLQYQNEQLIEELDHKNQSLSELNSRISLEKEEIVKINSLMADMAKLNEVDDVISAFLDHTSRLLGGERVVYFKHLTSYASLLLYKGAAIQIDEYRGVGISLKEIAAKEYSQILSQPQDLEPLKDLMMQVFQIPKFLAVPLISEEQVAGIFVTPEILDISNRRVFDSFMQILSVSYDNSVMKKRMHEMAIKDPLTGLYNRRFYNQKLEEEISRSRRTRLPVSLIYMDIDHFKKYNDNNGHHNGDLLLKTISQIMQKSSRANDIVARLGGEEFSIILPHTDKMGAAMKAEKLRRIIESTKFPHGEKQPMGFISISLGVSEYPSLSKDAEGLVKSADDALYKVKETTRNKVCLATVPDTFVADFIADKVPAYLDKEIKSDGEDT